MPAPPGHPPGTPDVRISRAYALVSSLEPLPAVSVARSEVRRCLGTCTASGLYFAAAVCHPQSSSHVHIIDNRASTKSAVPRATYHARPNWRRRRRPHHHSVRSHVQLLKGSPFRH